MVTREQQFAEAFERLKTDKGAHNYASIYASLPEDISSILELGVYWGGSLLAWQEMFPKAKIHGVDINLSLLQSKESPWTYAIRDRIDIEEADVRYLEPGRWSQFDLIIDDATHEPDHVLRMWDLLHKKAMRYYIIEDVYKSRMMQFWDHITKSVPKAQVMFWRTSDHCGDDRILPDSDSHCIVVKF